MPSGNSRDRRRTKRNGCSEYCFTAHEGFRSVSLDRWVLQTVALQMHQQYRKISGTNGPTHDFIVSTFYTHLHVDVWISFKSVVYHIWTLCYMAPANLQDCAGNIWKGIQVMLSSCAVNYIRIEFPSDHYAAIVFIILF